MWSDPDDCMEDLPVHVPWAKPPDGMLKLNVDGAYMAQTGSAGVGIILRRSDGSIVFTACRSLRLCSSALEAEISACIEGVRLALELNQDGILVETDSLEMVTATDSALSPGSSSAAGTRRTVTARLAWLSLNRVKHLAWTYLRQHRHLPRASQLFQERRGLDQLPSAAAPPSRLPPNPPAAASCPRGTPSSRPHYAAQASYPTFLGVNRVCLGGPHQAAGYIVELAQGLAWSAAASTATSIVHTLSTPAQSSLLEEREEQLLPETGLRVPARFLLLRYSLVFPIPASACTAVRESRPPKLRPLRSYTGRRAIRFLGSVSARLLAVVRLLLRRPGCFIDRSDYTMGDINNIHGGGGLLGATFRS
ncbi:hypothetical protein QYE76_027565 [Lolium multiflorum]|uniref:RNase H type-1 domain-containing protein n=1 Tax=Lolium multiflorum TaxID=4521 RepID=A0AAD8QK53_LOLMU|nr:hypothetical protein QYE76_027565 [Lolium multiflorum]